MHEIHALSESKEDFPGSGAFTKTGAESLMCVLVNIL